MKLIDADKLIDDIKKSGINKLSKGGDEVELTNFVKGLGEAIKIADTACVIDPVKHGHWEQVSDYDSNDNADFRCSVCQHGDTHAKDTAVNYCWYCGAKMSDKVSDK